jgi:hypothetical protein
MNPLDRLVGVRFAELCWDDTAAAREAALPLLSALAEKPQLMIDAMEHAMEDPELFPRSEADHFFDRAVLFEDYTRGCSIRLQHLHNEEYDRPHNHRATFVTSVLAGGYRHKVYGAPDDLDRRTGSVPMGPDEVARMRVLVDRHERVGSVYCIHHTTVHSTSPTADHLSVLVRAPSAKDRLFFVDDARGGAYWHWGSQFENPEEVAERRMTRQRMTDMIHRVEAL